jgi:hypothetical protein
MTANDPMAAVRAHIDAFNDGDAQAMSSVFANPGSMTAWIAAWAWTKGKQ